MGKMDEETYKIIRGMKTIQRQYPKKGRVSGIIWIRGVQQE